MRCLVDSSQGASARMIADQGKIHRMLGRNRRPSGNDMGVRGWLRTWRWLRLRRASANTLCHDAKTVGAALVTLAVALGSIVALATQGATHPNATGVHLTAGIALVGTVLVTIGWTGERLTRAVPVTEAHAETLRDSARFLLTSVVAQGHECDYGTGHKPREAFHAHYPTASTVLDRWDSLLKADIACNGALKERVWNQANEIAQASEGRWGLDRAHIAAHVTGSIRNRAHQNELDTNFSLGDNAPQWAVPMRDDDESAEDWAARIERNIARIEAFGRASQDWPEAKAVAESYRCLEGFKRDQRPNLIDTLQLVMEESPTFAKRCPTCRKVPT